jgi:hypothetical protein
VILKTRRPDGAAWSTGTKSQSVLPSGTRVFLRNKLDTDDRPFGELDGA